MHTSPLLISHRPARRTAQWLGSLLLLLALLLGAAPASHAQDFGTRFTLTDFEPKSGPVGTEVTIYGTDFPTDLTISTNIGWPVRVINSTTLRVIVNEYLSPGSRRLTVQATNADGDGYDDSFYPDQFTITTPPFTLTGLSPAKGFAGASIILTGTNFTGATAVSFSGTPASSFTVNSATQLTATVPVGATSGSVSVTTPLGTSNGRLFVVTPQITSFSPTSGPVGTVVTLQGAGFPGQAVEISIGNAYTNGIPANSNSLTFTVPSNATLGAGKISLLYQDSGWNWVEIQSADDFTVTLPTPTITSFSPGFGPVGTSITLTGTNFTGATAVTFTGASGNVVTSGFTVASATSITGVVVPAGATTGPITVTTPNGTATSPTAFTLTVPPLVTSLTPARNASAASRSTTVGLTFSTAIDPATAGNIRINATQYRGRRTATASVSGGTVTLTPTAPAGKPTDFKPGETVTVTVPASVQSTGGTGARPQVYQFTAATTGGGGGFVSSTTSAPRAMSNMQSASTQFVPPWALGDIDGDGDLDLLCGGYTPRPGYQGGIGKFTNDGTGIFNSTTAAALPMTSAGASSYGSVRNPQLGDVDGDGDLDLLVIYSNNMVGVHPNGGDASGSNTGVYSNANASYATLPGTNAGRIVLGDVDGDGDLDLVVPVGSAVAVRLNGGDATGSNTGTFAGGNDVPLSGTAGSAQLGDVDGDGDLDLVVPVGSVVAVRLNGGDATGSNTGIFAGGNNVPLSGTAGSAQLGDVDGDGDLDLVVGNSSTWSVRLNGGDATGSNTGTFTGGSELPSEGGTTFLLMGDVNGDGDLDILTNSNRNATQILQNSPPPAPTAGTLAPDNGLVGSSVVITGTNFTAGMTVMFNGTPATFVLNSATQLTAVVPAGATSGPISITNAGGTGSSAPFTVGLPSLTISTTGQTVAAGLYNNLTVTGTGAATLGGAVQVLGALTVQGGGTLLTNCQPLTGTGSFTLEAEATLGICHPAGIAASGLTGAVQVAGTRSFSSAAHYLYNGTAAQVTGPGLPATVRSLTLANASGAALSDDLLVSADLVMTSGVLSTGSHLLTLGSAATLNESTSSYVSGTVQTTRDLNAATDNDFGGLGLKLTPAAGSPMPGSTVVRRITGTARTGVSGRTGILRSFDIQPASNTGLDVKLVMSYRETELNGVEEASLALFKSETGAADTWGRQRNVTMNATANTATLAGVSSFSIWTLGNANAPLPVELTAFTAQTEGPAARLKWTTASEKNNAYFDVERSFDGRQFSTIGQQQGQGSKATVTSYTFLDEQLPAGTSYYRLRQVDHDGTASYSPVRSVTMAAGLATTTFVVYPTEATPGQPQRYAYTGPALPADAALEVYDATGRCVHRQAAGAAGLLAVKGLSSGWYWVRLRTATGPQQARFYQP